MKRTTISDIARLAQVSRGAVSLALNNKPGVSAQTRERVVAIAKSLGWTPNAAARALSSAKAAAVGLVLARPRASLDAERFYFQFICGVEAALTSSGQSLMLNIVDDVVEELEVYRSWWAQHRVDAVLLVDPRDSDPRPQRLVDLGLPFVTVGSHFAGGGAVLIDDSTLIERALDHLAQQGCRNVAYVCGFASLQHTIRRQQAFLDHGHKLKLRTRISNPTDYSEVSGSAETRRLLADNPPDALIFDNEILTLGGMAALLEAGLAIPKDVAVLSLEDSPICRVVSPQVSAFLRDPAQLGSAAAQLLLADHQDLAHRVLQMDQPELLIRESTEVRRYLNQLR